MEILNINLSKKNIKFCENTKHQFKILLKQLSVFILKSISFIQAFTTIIETSAEIDIARCPAP